MRWLAVVVVLVAGCGVGVSRAELEGAIGAVTACVDERLGRTPTFRHLSIGQVLVTPVQLSDGATHPEWDECWSMFGAPIDAWNLEHLPTNEDFGRMGRLLLACVDDIDPPLPADRRQHLERLTGDLVDAGTRESHEQAGRELFDLTGSVDGLSTCAEEAGWFNYAFDPE